MIIDLIDTSYELSPALLQIWQVEAAAHIRCSPVPASPDPAASSLCLWRPRAEAWPGPRDFPTHGSMS